MHREADRKTESARQKQGFPKGVYHLARVVCVETERQRQGDKRPSEERVKKRQ